MSGTSSPCRRANSRLSNWIRPAASYRPCQYSMRARDLLVAFGIVARPCPCGPTRILLWRTARSVTVRSPVADGLRVSWAGGTTTTQGRQAMDFGAAIFFTDYSMGPVELGRALEDRGFESLWAPEHSHIPLSRQSPFPQGGDLPKKYYDVMDPFVTLSAAAAATTRLRVGTGICLVVQRDPIQTAKAVASLDQISNGRFLFGIGGGWNAEEMADHGTDFKSRFDLMRERVEAMKLIWTKSKPEYHGTLVDFPPMMTWPKPAQKPHPPVIVGGVYPHGARRAIAYGDGWLPHARRPAYGDVLNLLPDFKKMAVAAGRDPATVPVTVFGVAEDLDLIKRYRDAGTARVVFNLNPAKADEVLPVLDRCTALMRQASA